MEQVGGKIGFQFISFSQDMDLHSTGDEEFYSNILIFPKIYDLG